VTEVRFLGTGDYLASTRYWNGFVVDGRFLVEAPPTALPHLRRIGVQPAEIEVVFLSHFHADHTFGWPFLLLGLLRDPRPGPVFVVGPPGVQAHLRRMMEIGGVAGVHDAAHRQLDLRYVDVTGASQVAGSLKFRAVEVDHVPYLRCYGFLIDLGSKTLGYTGDTVPCNGLDEIASSCDLLIAECNGPHAAPKAHLDVDDVVALRRRFPGLPFVLTHLGDGVDPGLVPNCVVPDDFAALRFVRSTGAGSGRPRGGDQ
jgi:ribonuclease Z